MARTLVLLASLAIICLLAYLSIRVVVDEGFGVKAIISLILLALLGFGVLGALTSPPPDG
jgi:hypothetical protein